MGVGMKGTEKYNYNFTNDAEDDAKIDKYYDAISY